MGKKAPEVYIELDNPYRSYFAGQTVSGRVVLQNRKEKKVKEVTILLEGSGRVHWTEHERHNRAHRDAHGRNHQRHTVQIWAEEKYVTLKISLAGDGENLMTLPEGKIVYPFQFILPRTLPSSFTSSVGIISYLLEAEIRKPLLKLNDRTCLPFTVNGIFDLNLEGCSPQECKKIKGSSFCACRKGQLGFALRLPNRSGFVPGEILDFKTEISNTSNKKIKRVKASLQQTVTFYAQGRSKVVKKTIKDVKGPEVDKGEDEMWSPGNLTIPSLPPTRLGGVSRLIDVQYALIFEMTISGLSTALTGKLPVMIGTIPLRSTFTQFQPQTGMGFRFPQSIEPAPGPSTSATAILAEKSSPAVIYVTPSAPLFPDYPDLPPPSYAEAVASEVFAWNNDGFIPEAEENIGSSKDMKEESQQPTAPPVEDFVPNYITYNIK